MTKRLTPKMEHFCVEFAIGGIASDAYRRAYSAVSMQDSTVHECASRLLADRKVAARVAELKGRIAQRLQLEFDVKVENVVSELKTLAFFDPRGLFRNGELIPFDELPPEVAKAIVSYDVDALYSGTGKDRVRIGSTIKVRWADKRAALVDLGKYLGMFKDKEQTPPVDSLKEFVDWLSARKTGIPVNTSRP